VWLSGTENGIRPLKNPMRKSGLECLKVGHFSSLGLAKVLCETPHFARAFATERRDIKLSDRVAYQNLIRLQPVVP
jgi:hypothetical protein